MANPTDVTAGKTDKVSNRHITLLVLGPSGSGKSSFIATVMSGKGSKDADIVSHDIESYTSTCTPHTFRFTDTKHNNNNNNNNNNNTTVTLIDSPGFNDTNRNDLDILQSIADFLTTTTGNIAGIILTHPITQNRMTGSARLNLAALKALCGEPFYPRVVVLTTMWNTIPSSAADDRRRQQMRDECTRRETQIMASPALWGDLVAGGARVMRFDGTPGSTACVLEHFIMAAAAAAGGGLGGSLSLANELGTGILLEETSAGRVLVEEKKRREKAHKEEMQRLEKLIEEEKKRKAQLDDDDVERRRGGGGGESAAALHDNTSPSVVVRAEQRGGLGPVVQSSGENDVITDTHERRDRRDRGGLRRGREEAGGDERGLAGIVLSGMVEMMTRRFQRSTD